MLRSIGAVVGSYIAMVLLIVGVFAGMWFGMGPDRLLEPGSFKGNTFLCIAAPATTLIAGLLGGWMCAKIARSTKAVIALADLVLLWERSPPLSRSRSRFRPIRELPA